MNEYSGNGDVMDVKISNNTRRTSFNVRYQYSSGSLRDAYSETDRSSSYSCATSLIAHRMMGVIGTKRGPTNSCSSPSSICARFLIDTFIWLAIAISPSSDDSMPTVPVVPPAHELLLIIRVIIGTGEPSSLTVGWSVLSLTPTGSVQ